MSTTQKYIYLVSSLVVITCGGYFVHAGQMILGSLLLVPGVVMLFVGIYSLLVQPKQ
jgi:ABC-type bacteriocin/lantibiotic exporter with double-glycine peptidase domain